MPLGLLNIVFSVLSMPLAVRAGEEFIEGLASPLVGVFFSLVGILVASRQSRNPIGWIFLLIGLSQGFVVFAYGIASAAYGPNPPAWSMLLAGTMSVIAQTAWLPGLSLMMTYGLLLFPNGRLPSKHWRPAAWLSALPLLMFAILTVLSWPHRGADLFLGHAEIAPGGAVGSLLSELLFPVLLLCGASSLASMAFRFVRSRGVERQQLKWMALAGSITLAYFFLIDVLPAVASLVVAPAIPTAAGIAILKHRLYDIDLIIRRTLSWALLTSVLGAIYLGGIVVSQGLLRAVIGRESQLAVVVTTLAVAALFTPLRRRFQALIDRAFYRRRYDPNQILQRFGTSARSEVELALLAGSLARTIDDALQPALVSVWLRDEKPVS